MSRAHPATVFEHAVARHVPPVHKHAWTTDRPLSFTALAEEVRARFALDAEAWQRVLWHGGLRIAGQPVSEAAPPAEVPAETLVLVYAYAYEPEVVRVGAADILWRNDRAVAVNKPPWLTVQGTRASQRLSLEVQLRELLGAAWITPAHRLDRHTSGVILFALDPEAARVLHQQFERREVAKEYLAWVRPAPTTERWTVCGDLRQVEHPRHACFALGAPGTGRASETAFERVEVAPPLALVRALPRTGRTHQIRVHLAHGGTPIAGDPLYAPTPWPEPAPPRLMLHARSLRLVLPGVGPAELCAPEPSDFVAFAARARLASAAHPC